MDGGSALSSLLRTLLALVGVCALAFVVLAMVARRGGLGARFAGSLGSRAPARLRVLERVVLSPRRQLYLVQADARVFLLGAGEAGPLALIAELAEAPSGPAQGTDEARDARAAG
jgi:flagellar biogenesis protein FliO